jgi:hypothetical protein
MVLTAYFVVSLVIGLSCHHPRAIAEALSRVDTSIEISGRHDFAVRDRRIRLLRLLRPPHLPSDVRDDRETPLLRAEDARRSADDLPDVTSEKACGTLARRANQVIPANSLRRNVNIAGAGAHQLQEINCTTSPASCRTAPSGSGARGSLERRERAGRRSRSG